MSCRYDAMRIAIDALGIHNFGGGRTATMTLLKGLFAIDNKNEYHIFLSQAEPSLYKQKGNIHQIIYPGKNRFLVRLWAQLVLPVKIRNFDLVHFAKNLGVFGLTIPTVVTIYDLTTLIHPELFPKFDVWYWKSIENKFLNNASRIIAISETTAHDLVQHYNLPAERIKVIYPSIDPCFLPIPPLDIARVREKYCLPESYILHVGRIDIKKKLTLLVESYALAKEIYGSGFTDRLVFVGDVYPKGKDEALFPTIERLGLTKEVIFAGGIPDDDLPAIMTGAKVVVSASIHEGFGLAPVEAMACGTPVIAYRAGALQEAVGDAALFIDTLDRESMARAIIKIYKEPELRAELSLRGLIRAQMYQPEKNSRKILQLYEDIVHENQRES
jgi:glycosyltransferase involved in cell wall biosynthesis